MPSSSKLINNDVDARRTVDTKNIVLKLGSTFTGNVAFPQLAVGIYTAKSKKTKLQIKKIERCRVMFFSRSSLMASY
jgi:hypothetical protein